MNYFVGNQVENKEDIRNVVKICTIQHTYSFQKTFVEDVAKKAQELHNEGFDIMSVSLDNYLSALEITNLIPKKSKPNTTTSVGTIVYSHRNNEQNRRCDMKLKYKIVQSGMFKTYDNFVSKVKDTLNSFLENRAQIVSVSFSTTHGRSLNNTWCLIMYCGWD